MSLSLLEANDQLLQLRSHLPEGKKRPISKTAVCGDPPQDLIEYGQQLLRQCRQRDGLIAKATIPSPANQLPLFPHLEPKQKPQKQDDFVKIYPSIVGAAMHEHSRQYRLYLVFRHLDKNGRGWLGLDKVRSQLTSKENALYLCTWRNLRMILNEGGGIFWNYDQDNGRVWLLGLATIATKLQVEKLAGKCVLFPAKHLFGKIGTFKSEIFAAWHSGRDCEKPISREIQRKLTRIPESTQRRYCNNAQVRRKRSIALGERHCQATLQERAWYQGDTQGKVFVFVDYKGKHGPQNGRYLAWHLPMTYEPKYSHAPNGRRKKINASLVKNGTRGKCGVNRVFHANGVEAVKAHRKQVDHDHYWPSNMKSQTGICFWHTISRKKMSDISRDYLNSSLNRLSPRIRASKTAVVGSREKMSGSKSPSKTAVGIELH